MPRDNHYAKEAQSRPVPECPGCGFCAIERQTKYGLRCFCPRCGLWSWDRHPLVDAETHEARKAAHEAFDELWRSGTMSRRRAYRLLAEKLGMSRDECHIKFMDKETAARVVAVAEEIVEEIS